jgi:hypothetical protein
MQREAQRDPLGAPPRADEPAKGASAEPTRGCLARTEIRRTSYGSASAVLQEARSTCFQHMSAIPELIAGDYFLSFPQYARNWRKDMHVRRW